MKTKKTAKTQKENKTESLNTAGANAAVCSDSDCHIHGNLKVRGKVFEGVVIRKFHKRIAIEFERMIYIRKYERYAKSRTKVHARLPTCMSKDIQIGDLVRVQECRPLSKIIHFVVIQKISSEISENNKKVVSDKLEVRSKKENSSKKNLGEKK